MQESRAIKKLRGYEKEGFILQQCDADRFPFDDKDTKETGEHIVIHIVYTKKAEKE
jgi:hypothetical protein